MYLSALTIGCAVPRPSFEAVIHSGFQSAANLRLTKSGKLLTLVVSSEADLPQGIRLNTPTDFSFTGLQVGEPATCQNGILRIDSLSLTIDLTQARLWKCDLPALKTDLTKPETASALSNVWQALNQRQRNAGADIVAENVGRIFNPPYAKQGSGVSQKITESMRALLQPTQQFDLTGTSVIRELIGLGSGLTPAGDDLLIGYLAGLWCTVGDEPERQEFVSGLGRKIVRLSRRTNDISRMYLYHAARGQVSSRLAALAEAISLGETGEPLLTIAENAMRVGHTSGMDAATGLLVGLTAWSESSFNANAFHRKAR
jgi:hypothetical protein